MSEWRYRARAQQDESDGEPATGPGKVAATTRLHAYQGPTSVGPERPGQPVPGGMSGRIDCLGVDLCGGALSRAAAGDGDAVDGPEHAVSAAMQSPSTALPETLRGELEGSLGVDLSGVRVHTGSESQTASQSLGAAAWALGQDVHFAAGRFDPESATGQGLIAHEVAHTVQQCGAETGAVQEKLAISAPGDASRAGGRAVRGRIRVGRHRRSDAGDDGECGPRDHQPERRAAPARPRRSARRWQSGRWSGGAGRGTR
jgi:hypothetical protein